MDCIHLAQDRHKWWALLYRTRRCFKWGISWLAEELLASQGPLYEVGVVTDILCNSVKTSWADNRVKEFITFNVSETKSIFIISLMLVMNLVSETLGLITPFMRLSARETLI
jgi:hypothetical protein